jgi:hypothetical protein
MALLEDGASVWGLSPLRPRLSRLLPRTRQSERVRATMMTRQREGDQQRDQAQVCNFLNIKKLKWIMCVCCARKKHAIFHVVQHEKVFDNGRNVYPVCFCLNLLISSKML